MDYEEDELDDDSPTLSEKDGTLYNKDGSKVESDLPLALDTHNEKGDEKGSTIKNNPLLTPVIIYGLPMFYWFRFFLSASF